MNEEQPHDKKRAKALKRAQVLKESIADYGEALKNMQTGFNQWERILENQERIKRYFKASDEEWENWHWQVKNRIKSSAVLKELLYLSDQEVAEIDKTGSKFRWVVSPYYLSLIDPENKSDPVRLQSIPQIQEIVNNGGYDDPMAEEYTSPAPAVSRRYADRLIILVTNQCAMYCRHCQRRRAIGEKDLATPKEDLEKALQYVRENEEIRDVLLTGGDAFMLSNRTIDWLLTELDSIDHVETKRLGTRTLVTMPQRVDDELLEILESHMPVYVSTHFNHPLEVTPRAKEACFKLARAGVNLGNQAVLLKGINNDPFVMRKLNQMLLEILVRPYYLFHAKAVKGTTHFRTKVEEGIEIMEKLRGFTSGLAIPTYVVNAPLGQGKTPMLPEYLVSSGKDYIMIRTWENLIVPYEN